LDIVVTLANQLWLLVLSRLNTAAHAWILPLERGCMRTELSATLFLTDPESYQGSGFMIAALGGEHAVKLAACDMNLYASGARHRVDRPPPSGPY
jgi:predicted 2-oxoglutarate/Fe(II)-dependent dioxygenase YbiX